MKLEFDPIAVAPCLEISDAEIERTGQVKPGVILGQI